MLNIKMSTEPLLTKPKFSMPKIKLGEKQRAFFASEIFWTLYLPLILFFTVGPFIFWFLTWGPLKRTARIWILLVKRLIILRPGYLPSDLVIRYVPPWWILRLEASRLHM